jgi:hypothetical protein
MMKRGVTSATFHYAFSCSVPFAVRTYSTIICSARRHASFFGYGAKWSESTFDAR